MAFKIYDHEQGFVHEAKAAVRTTPAEQDRPLPSLDITSLHPAEAEVAHLFHLPFQELVSPVRLRAHQFRGITPYWAINVSDIVSSSAGRKITFAPETNVDEIGGGREGRLEVWGLTGWYLNLLMRALEVFV